MWDVNVYNQTNHLLHRTPISQCNRGAGNWVVCRAMWWNEEEEEGGEQSEINRLLPTPRNALLSFIMQCGKCFRDLKNCLFTQPRQVALKHASIALNTSQHRIDIIFALNSRYERAYQQASSVKGGKWNLVHFYVSVVVSHEDMNLMARFTRFK